MLEVAGLQCERGDRCLFSDVGFRLQAGELLYLHGHNGSGKTTLLRTLCGLIEPTAGKILWQGKSIRKQREEYAAELVYIGHKNALKDDLTGVENLRVSCALDGFKVSRQKAWNALERMGLKGHEDLPTQVLSQGQKRRVTLARLLIDKSRLWILDEPFTALDVNASQFLQSILQKHLAAGGMVILTTHQEVELTSGEIKRLRLGWKKHNDV
ncbi:MAG: cytochrome c biogenesis heme-transporting ATPase CcmA [gamma proteobacterium symbiont of Bathyaustriella thionipta]|nr:cytochrome c biogenesis heme-transporting ATPase CcmA [gamma proteobacterium symbiont of Bathyaustriella thionipta]